MSILRKILKWISILVFVCAGTVLLFNAFDEDLKPEAAAFAESPKPRFEDKENSYFALMGFFAPAGAEPHAAGRKIVTAYETALARNPSLGSFSAGDQLEGKKLSVRGKVAELCDVEKGPCLGRYLAAEPLVRELLTDNQEVLQRYQRLYSYPHFGEIATPSVAEPNAGYPIRLVPLVNAEIALAFKQGDISAALDRLEQDIAFWRRLLRESKACISKMVAVRAIITDYQLLADIINFDETVTRQHHERIEKMVVLLDREESSLAGCLRREFAVTVRMLRSLPANYFYQSNASINDAYRLFKAISDLAEMSAAQFPAARTGTQNTLRNMFEVESAWWRLVYNPIGRSLGSNSVNYSTYIASLHDLDGYLRLVALQLQIRKLGLADAQITEFLRTADKRYANPYTGQSMQLDSKQRVLFFNGLSKRFSKDGVIRASLGS